MHVLKCGEANGGIKFDVRYQFQEGVDSSTNSLEVCFTEGQNTPVFLSESSPPHNFSVQHRKHRALCLALRILLP